MRLPSPSRTKAPFPPSRLPGLPPPRGRRFRRCRGSSGSGSGCWRARCTLGRAGSRYTWKPTQDAATDACRPRLGMPSLPHPRHRHRRPPDERECSASRPPSSNSHTVHITDLTTMTVAVGPANLQYQGTGTVYCVLKIIVRCWCVGSDRAAVMGVSRRPSILCALPGGHDEVETVILRALDRVMCTWLARFCIAQIPAHQASRGVSAYHRVPNRRERVG